MGLILLNAGKYLLRVRNDALFDKIMHRASYETALMRLAK